MPQELKKKPFPTNRGRKSRLVRDRMSTPPHTVTSEDSLESAFHFLHKHNIRELPVVEDGKLIGIVTDRDLREIAPSYPIFRDQQEIRHYLQKLKVSSAMSPDPLVVSPTTSLIEAASLLLTYRIGSLPVVQDKDLVGIISVTDFLRLFIEQNRGGRTGDPSRHHG